MPTLAKLTRPKVHRALRRESLFEALDECRERPLVWIVAPPGAGKTTLVASYVETRKAACVWYQLDAGDADIASFFYYLSQAVPAARSKRAAPLPLLTAEYRADPLAFSRHFFRECFTRLPAGGLIALDNYHELPLQSELHGVIAQAVAEVPEGCNIVAISRAEPPPELLALRLAERLVTIDWSRLRLSLEETRAIAATRAHDVDDATLHEIYRLSDGWAAGVALTLQRVRQLRERPAQAEHEALGDLFDYFAAQVLKSAPPATQDFLRRTALLPAMTAEMAQRLTGREDSETILEDLYRRGVFTDRRNTRPAVYQYHDLFRTFLREQLESALAPPDLAQAQQRAAALLEGAAQPAHAIRLYLRAGDEAAAKRVILESAPALVAQGRGASLREWIAALPAPEAEGDPWLDYWLGAASSRLAPTSARIALERAFAIFEARGDVDGQRVVCAEIILTYMYEFAILHPLDRWIDESLRLLADAHPFPSPLHELGARTACLFALSFHRPDDASVEQCIERVLALLPLEIPPELAVVSGGVLLLHLYAVGDIAACARIATRQRALLEAAEISPPARAVAEMQLGHATLRDGDPAGAQRHFERALEMAAAHAISLPTLHVYSHLGLAFCAIERGELARAESHRTKIEEHWIPGRKTDEVAGLRVQLWIAFSRGHWDSAVRTAERHLALAEECGLFMLVFESHILLAIACAEAGRPADCTKALRPVHALVAGTSYARRAYEAELVEAYAALIAREVALCRSKLRSGLAGSRMDPGMFILRMHPELLSRLLSEALASGIEKEYATERIRELRLRAPAHCGDLWPWPLRIYTLGRFEVVRDGQPLEFSRKAPKKTLALLKAIIAHGGRNVREQLVLDAFWPDEEGDAAARSLTAALHRLRALIGDGDAIVQQGGTLSLDDGRVWVDAWALEAALARNDAAHGDEVLALYRGGFLVEDEGEPWSVAMRERLRSRFIHALGQHGRALEDANGFDAAIECYLRGIDADPAIEQFYQGLMRCYARLDRLSEAVAAYRRLKQILSISLSLKPSPSTEKLYQALRLDKVST